MNKRDHRQGNMVLKYHGQKLPLKGKWMDLQKIAEFLPEEKRTFYRMLTHTTNDQNQKGEEDDNECDTDVDYDA